MAKPFGDQILLPFDPSGALQAATKQYVDGMAFVPTSRQVLAGTGLSGGGNLTADRTFTVSYGTSSTTACVGNDSRLSDSRAPSGTAGGALNGTYPNPALDVVPWAPATITYAATITPDASTGCNFKVTATAALAVAVPTNPTDGQMILLEVLASGADRVVTMNASIIITGPYSAATTVTSGKVGFFLLRYTTLGSSAWRLVGVVVDQ